MSTATQDTVAAKLERQFDALDVDQDGFLSWTDYETLGRRYLDAYKVDKDDRRAHAILAMTQMHWVELLRHAAVDADRLTKEQYVTATRLLAVDTSRFQMIDGSSHAIFDLVDADGDNEISRQEFGRMLREVWKSDAPEALQAFDTLDTDGDGAISRVEFIRSVREHYLSDDPKAPGSLFFGQV